MDPFRLRGSPAQDPPRQKVQHRHRPAHPAEHRRRSSGPNPMAKTNMTVSLHEMIMENGSPPPRSAPQATKNTQTTGNNLEPPSHPSGATATRDNRLGHQPGQNWKCPLWNNPGPGEPERPQPPQNIEVTHRTRWNAPTNQAPTQTQHTGPHVDPALENALFPENSTITDATREQQQNPQPADAAPRRTNPELDNSRYLTQHR